MDKPLIIEHANKSLNYTLFDSKWVPKSARCVVVGSNARSTGQMEVYSLTKGQLVQLTSVEKPAAFKCCTFGASSLQSRHLATGDFTGNVQLWDLERPDIPLYSVKGHSAVINAIDGCGGLNIGAGAPELVTGSRDGSVKVWDVRVEEPVAEMAPEDGQATRDCWAVGFGNAFNQEERMVVAGYDNGDLKMFDLRTMSLHWETKLDNGICSLQFDRKDIPANKLLVTCLESRIHVFDMRTFHSKEGYACLNEKAHKSTVWCGSHLPQNRDVFMTCGGEGGLNLWKYSYPDKRSMRREGESEDVGVVGEINLVSNVNMASQPISSLDWNRDKKGLFVSTAFDQTLRVCVVANVHTL